VAGLKGVGDVVQAGFSPTGDVVGGDQDAAVIAASAASAAGGAVEVLGGGR
jgi:hypothetical protein